jgi:segregation and condensation protein B
MSEIEAPSGRDLVAAVGAVIFASPEPVEAREIADALGAGLTVADVEEAIERLESIHRDSDTGIVVERVAGGVRLVTRKDVGAWVRSFFRQRNRTRLSPAALETLAIVAYRQPVTAPEIQAIRGKDPTAALKGLVDKKLVTALGRKKVVGSPLLYGTSKYFLEHFGLNNLADLPSMEEFDQLIGLVDLGPEAIADDEAEAEATDGAVAHVEDEDADEGAAGAP